MRRAISGVVLAMMIFMTGILSAGQDSAFGLINAYTEGRAYAYLQPFLNYYKLHIVFPDTEIILPHQDEHYTNMYALSPDGTPVFGHL